MEKENKTSRATRRVRKTIETHEGRSVKWKKKKILLVRAKHGQSLKDQKCGFHHLL